jgi:thymidylate synthase ThyX
MNKKDAQIEIQWLSELLLESLKEISPEIYNWYIKSKPRVSP